MRADGHHRAAPVLPVGVQDRRRVLVTWPQRRPGPSDIEGPRQALRQRMSRVLPAHPQLGLRQQRLNPHPEHRRREARVIGDVQPPLARAHEIGQDGHILRRQCRSRGEDDIDPVRGGRQRPRRAPAARGGSARDSRPAAPGMCRPDPPRGSEPRNARSCRPHCARTQAGGSRPWLLQADPLPPIMRQPRSGPVPVL